MTPESVLVGVVVHASTGAPVEGVVVWANERGSNAFDGGLGSSSRTDGDGRFRLVELEPGTYKPMARGDELYGVLAEQVHLGLGETSEEVVIRVHPAVTVSAEVVIAGARGPCREGSVSLQAGVDMRESAAIDDEGRVEFRGLLTGSYRVTVHCSGYVSADEYPEILVGDDNIAGLVWEVREGLAIRGEVVDEAGQSSSLARGRSARASSCSSPRA